MLGPAYTIPTSRRMVNHELSRYVKAEFSDRDCHWFTCSPSANSASEGRGAPKRGWISRVLGTDRSQNAPGHSPAIVPCAVLVSNMRDDENCVGTAPK